MSTKPPQDPKIVYLRHMEKNLFSDQHLTDLQDFMFDTMASADMAVDWFCDRHEVSATDDVIDFVVDAHFAFFGNWVNLSLSFFKPCFTSSAAKIDANW